MDCYYCGEEKATENIMNPNWDDEEPFWEVCADCKEVIMAQQKMIFGNMMTKFNEKTGRKMVMEAHETLRKAALRTGKPILNAEIYKKGCGEYDEMSVEYIGNEDKDV